jgi:hypothetical protein
MNIGKGCLQSRPRGPGPKISPARKGCVHRQAVERWRCDTTLFACSLGAADSLKRVGREMTGFLYRQQKLGCPTHLARFSRDVGYHGTRRATLSMSLGAKPTCPGVPWRDLQFTPPATNSNQSTTLPLVIPTGAKRSGGTCGSLNHQPTFSCATDKTLIYPT